MVHNDLWGYPSVEDRVLQAAVKQKLEPIFEEKFLDCSYGFRSKRSAHMALEKIRKDLLDGYVYVSISIQYTFFKTFTVNVYVLKGTKLFILNNWEESAHEQLEKVYPQNF